MALMMIALTWKKWKQIKFSSTLELKICFYLKKKMRILIWFQIFQAFILKKHTKNFLFNKDNHL